MKWYYTNDRNEVIGPISETTLIELRACGSIDIKTKVCAQDTEVWLPYEQAFPVERQNPQASSVTKASDSKDSALAPEVATPPPLPEAVDSDSLEKSPENPPTQPLPPTKQLASKSKNQLTPILIGCGGVLLLFIMIGVVALIAVSSSSNSNDSSDATPSSHTPTAQQNYSYACRRCSGSGRLTGQCNQCYGAGTIMTSGTARYGGDLEIRREPVQVPCPKCRGGGQMAVACTRCRGSGRSR